MNDGSDDEGLIWTVAFILSLYSKLWADRLDREEEGLGEDVEDSEVVVLKKNCYMDDQDMELVQEICRILELPYTMQYEWDAAYV